MEDWINNEGARNSVRRDNIYLTKKDAEYILSMIGRQEEYYNKHRDRVKTKIWEGEKINGIDVSNGLTVKQESLVQDEKDPAIHHLIKREVPNPSHQFLKNRTGHAYIIFVDGKLNVFQPHHPGVQGWHAMTHPTIPHPISKQIVDKCATCGESHHIDGIMEKQRDEMVKNLAGSEIFTKILYMAQEIYDKRMDFLSKMADQG